MVQTKDLMKTLNTNLQIRRYLHQEETVELCFSFVFYAEAHNLSLRAYLKSLIKSPR